LFSKIQIVESDVNRANQEENKTIKYLEANQYPTTVINQARRKSKNKGLNRKEDETKSVGTVVIPYVHGLSEQIRKVNSKFNVRTAFKSGNTLRSHLTKVKPRNKILETKNSVYKIDCECDKSYFGQTSGPVKTRIKEHIYNYKMKNSEKSKLVEHAVAENHTVKFESSTLICNEPSWTKRNQIESACMTIFKNKCISQPSLNFSNIFIPVVEDEIKLKVQNSTKIFD